MLSTQTIPSHITFDDAGRPWVAGTGRKVAEVVIDHKAGLDAGQIHAAHPDLPLAKIHAALAYYFDNQSAVDAEIARERQFVDDVRAQHPPTVTRATLESRLAGNAP